MPDELPRWDCRETRSLCKRLLLRVLALTAQDKALSPCFLTCIWKHGQPPVRVDRPCVPFDHLLRGGMADVPLGVTAHGLHATALSYLAALHLRPCQTSFRAGTAVRLDRHARKRLLLRAASHDSARQSPEPLFSELYLEARSASG